MKPRVVPHRHEHEPNHLDLSHLRKKFDSGKVRFYISQIILGSVHAPMANLSLALDPLDADIVVVSRALHISTKL